MIALDVLRCLRRRSAHHTLADTYGTGRLADRWKALREKGDRLLELPGEEAEMRIGRYADELARTVMATLLFEQAEYEAEATGNGRTFLVAHAHLALLNDPDALPRTALDHLAELADGGRVPLALVPAINTGNAGYQTTEAARA